MVMGMATTAGAITVAVVMVMAAGADLRTKVSAVTVVSTAETASMAVDFMEAVAGFTVAVASTEAAVAMVVEATEAGIASRQKS